MNLNPCAGAIAFNLIKNVENDENVIVLFDIEHYGMKIAIILILILGGENGGGNTSYKTFSVF